MAARKSAQNTTFEQDLERLESLIQSIRDSSVEDTVDKYAEAMKLLVSCKTRLDGYRKKVESVSADGTVTDISGAPDIATDD